MKVTLAQTAPKLNRSNLTEVCDIIQSNLDSDLIVFPELSLSGYMLMDKLSEDAWSLDELSPLIEFSKEIDIVVGLALKKGDGFTNSALYFSKGALLSQHDKVHLPNYGMFEEARYFQAGSVFESFQCQFGKASMLICEDLWHKNVHHDLIQENPDLILALIASPARGFSDEGLEIRSKWMDIIATVAKECRSKVLFVNRVGFEDGLGFWGGSCLLDEDANTLIEFPLFEKTVQTIKV